MPAKVSNITIDGFRGATSRVDIPFDATKALTLIFGENGTGKSTIIDAFDFVCNQAYGSLDNYSIGTASQKRKHISALKGKPSDLKITLNCASQAWTATLGKDGPVVSPASGYPDIRILRRKSILELIEAIPSKRYEALKAFIAVPGIDKSEKALRDAVTSIESNYNESIRALGQANEALVKLWTDEGRPAPDAITWACAESKKDISQLNATLTEIGDIETAFQRAEDNLSALDKALSALRTAQEDQVKVQDKQKEAEGKQTQKSPQLLKLLEDAKAYIALKGSLGKCPVCEQGIEAVKLTARLGERIDEMQEIAPLVTATRIAIRDTEGKKTLADEKQKVFCESARRLYALLSTSGLQEVKSAQANPEPYILLAKDSEPSEAAEQQGRQLVSILSPLKDSLELRKEGDQKSVNQHNAIFGHYDSLQCKAFEAKGYEGLLGKLKEMLNIVSGQRKSYIEEILSSIADEVETLYTKIHPGEGIGKIRFFLKPNAIGSLEFDCQYYDTAELPPQAYYSESHLDTLGICVFLALSNRFKTEKTVIILDDVLTSIDSSHLDRFISLIHEQAPHFNQVIATTHYRPWRDKYRWAKGPTANTQVIELGPWTLQNGLQTGQFLTAVSELRKTIESATIDRQAVASKAGIVLESLFDFITLKYHCPVPRNVRNEFTLGDLASGIDSRLSKELRSSKISSDGNRSDTPLKSLIDACVSEQWVRNAVGCHFSSLGSEIADGDVRKFCQAVLELAGRLICDSCEMLPTRRPSGSKWQCSCGKLELYPLIYPGSDPSKVDDEL